MLSRLRERAMKWIESALRATGWLDVESEFEAKRRVREKEAKRQRADFAKRIRLQRRGR